MIENVPAWKEEVLFTGNIVQDGDNTVSREEAVRRGNRYLDLVEKVAGDEGEEVFRTLIASLQARHDYGAYHSTFDAVERFPDNLFGKPFIEALLPLIPRMPDWAGRLLASLCRERGRVAQFNQALSHVPSVTRDEVMAFVRNQEREGGWLEYDIGKLRPSNC